MNSTGLKGVTMFRSIAKATLVLGLVMFGWGVERGSAVAGPKLTTPDGAQVDAADVPYFRYRPKVIGFLQKIVDNKREGDMALAVSPPFCPSYSWTAWGGEDPVARASLKCQARLDKLLDDAELPVAERLGCKCSIAIKNMTVLDPAALERASYFTNVKMLIRRAGAALRKRTGILEYEKNDLVKQDFALFNAKKVRICSGRLEFKIGELGRFSGTCLGDNPITDGGVVIGCPSGVFCTRHIVGNMKVGNGTLIGFASGLNAKEMAEKYPGLPERFEVRSSSDAPQEEEIND